MKRLSVFKFISLIILINITIYYYPFYKYVFSHLNIFSIGGTLTFFSILVILYVITSFVLFFIALISLRALKIFSMIMMIMNSIALYFISTYHVILDKTMMGNVFNTDKAEAASYFSPKIFIYFFMLGVVPAYLVSKIDIQKSKKIRLAMQSFGIVIIGMFLVYLNSSTWLWIDKNAKNLGALAMPWSYTVNAARYQITEFKQNRKQELLPNAYFTNNNKTLVVLVIGESARANNYSLYGYNKETNPYLNKLNVVALKGAISSATYTTASVNSMLSPTGSTSDGYEPLPSYLQRQGVDVIWRSNNWGEPKMTVQTYQKAEDLRMMCSGDGCDYDEVLLTGLDKEIKNAQKDKIFIVLHIAGSHGPTYYKKYPQAFEVFKPVCKSVDLQKCTKQELFNAYDNSIVYTDYFLSKLIEILKNNNEIPSVMIYLSDHGESLGEYGFYLHGTPYAVAPDFQKHIPFIVWASPAFARDNALESTGNANEYSQKNVFHTVMGAFNMTSSIYNKDLDIFQKKSTAIRKDE